MYQLTKSLFFIDVVGLVAYVSNIMYKKYETYIHHVPYLDVAIINTRYTFIIKSNIHMYTFIIKSNIHRLSNVCLDESFLQ